MQTYDLKTIIQEELGSELSNVNKIQKDILINEISKELNDIRLINITKLVVEDIIFQTT